MLTQRVIYHLYFFSLLFYNIWLLLLTSPSFAQSIKFSWLSIFPQFFKSRDIARDFFRSRWVSFLWLNLVVVTELSWLQIKTAKFQENWDILFLLGFKSLLHYLDFSILRTNNFQGYYIVKELNLFLMKSTFFSVSI